MAATAIAMRDGVSTNLVRLFIVRPGSGEIAAA
jgi:hypothetical protein